MNITTRIEYHSVCFPPKPLSPSEKLTAGLIYVSRGYYKRRGISLDLSKSGLSEIIMFNLSVHNHFNFFYNYFQDPNKHSMYMYLEANGNTKECQEGTYIPKEIVIDFVIIGK